MKPSLSRSWSPFWFCFSFSLVAVALTGQYSPRRNWLSTNINTFNKIEKKTLLILRNPIGYNPIPYVGMQLASVSNFSSLVRKLIIVLIIIITNNNLFFFFSFWTDLESAGWLIVLKFSSYIRNLLPKTYIFVVETLGPR